MPRKPAITQTKLDEMAENAEDVATEIEETADRITITDPLDTLDAIAKFNRLAEASNRMNRALLSIARLRRPES